MRCFLDPRVKRIGFVDKLCQTQMYQATACLVSETHAEWVWGTSATRRAGGVTDQAGDAPLTRPNPSVR